MLFEAAWVTIYIDDIGSCAPWIGFGWLGLIVSEPMNAMRVGCVTLLQLWGA